MNDLISRQSAIDALWGMRQSLDESMDRFLAMNMMTSRAVAKAERNRIENDIQIIESLPTIEAAPIKHGHWIEKIIYSHSYAECSECKTVYSWSETETMRFCKRCGANMREVK